MKKIQYFEYNIFQNFIASKSLTICLKCGLFSGSLSQHFMANVLKFYGQSNGIVGLKLLLRTN